jgi:hypothetical protein
MYLHDYVLAVNILFDGCTLKDVDEVKISNRKQVSTCALKAWLQSSSEEIHTIYCLYNPFNQSTPPS